MDGVAAIINESSTAAHSFENPRMIHDRYMGRVCEAILQLSSQRTEDERLSGASSHPLG